MDWWQEIQWTASLEETYHSQGEIFSQKRMWWYREISFCEKQWGRNGFSLCRKITTTQQDPEQLIDKLILCILHTRRLSTKYKYPPSSIIAMCEISFCNDTVPNTTIDMQEAKSVCLKTTGKKNVWSAYA